MTSNEEALQALETIGVFLRKQEDDPEAYRAALKASKALRTYAEQHASSKAMLHVVRKGLEKIDSEIIEHALRLRQQGPPDQSENEEEE